MAPSPTTAKSTRPLIQTGAVAQFRPELEWLTIGRLGKNNRDPSDTGPARRVAAAHETIAHSPRGSDRKLGFTDYNGHLEVHNSLLNMVLHEKPQITRDENGEG